MSNLGNPLNPAQWEALGRLMDGVSLEQTIWISGYAAGFAAARQSPGGLGAVKLESAVTADQAESALLTAQPQTKPEMTVLFGSQTGNAEKLARALNSRLANQGFPVKIESMGNYKPAQLKRDSHLLIIVSTYGEGDPPDNALAFHEFLLGKKAPSLQDTQFSVLALGDSSYEHFCKTGRDIDERLAELGASRLLTRVDCDVDYEETAEAWMDSVLARLQPIHLLDGSSPDEGQRNPGFLAIPPLLSYSKKSPFLARLLTNQALTGRGSSKEVRHIELSIADVGLAYEPGDSLGVVASNWPQRVDELIESLGFDGGATVLGANGT
ncbi:MAG: flavodoxin domain-containing protein, partial [Candidatus Methylumidiphilus sp.]